MHKKERGRKEERKKEGEMKERKWGREIKKKGREQKQRRRNPKYLFNIYSQKWKLTCKSKSTLWQYCDWSAQMSSHFHNLPVGPTKEGHTLAQMLVAPLYDQAVEQNI